MGSARINAVRQRIALWEKEEYDRRDLIYKTRPKQLHKRKDRKLKDEKVVPGHEGVSYIKGHYKDLKKGTKKHFGLDVTEENKNWQHGPGGKVEYSHRSPVMDRFYQELPKATSYRAYDMGDSLRQHDEEMAFVESGRKIQPRKPTRMDWRAIISAKQLRQRIAQVRLAATEQQTIEGGIAPERVKGRPKRTGTNAEVRDAFWEGKPMRTKAKLGYGGMRQPPAYRTNGKDLYLFGHKIFSKTDEGGLKLDTKRWVKDKGYRTQTFNALRFYGVKVDTNGVIDPTRQYYTEGGLAMKTETKANLFERNVTIPKEEITNEGVRLLDPKKSKNKPKKVGPAPLFTRDNLSDFAAESSERATTIRDETGKEVLERKKKIIKKGDPSGTKVAPRSETATQPDDAMEVNRILGLPEEQGLEKTFGKKSRGKYPPIEGSKTHHILYKENIKARKHPLSRFKHIRNVKASPKGSNYQPFANNPENAIQISEAEHTGGELFAPQGPRGDRKSLKHSLHSLNPHSNFRRIFEGKIRMARLKIARIRQRNISRRVTQINMAKEDYDPDNAWFEMDRELNRLENTPGSEGNWTYHKGKLVNFEHEKDTLDLLDSVEGDPNYSMFSVSNTHDIVDRKDPQLKTKFNEFVKQGFKPTVGRWEGKFDATVNFRDKDRKQVEKIARGELNEFGKPIRAQQSYVETTEIPRKAPTGPRKFKTKFFNYNEETDTYEE